MSQSQKSDNETRSYKHEVAEMAALLAAGWQHDGFNMWTHPHQNRTITRSDAIAELRRTERENFVIPYHGEAQDPGSE